MPLPEQDTLVTAKKNGQPRTLLDESAVRSCYRRYARIYNAVFGLSLEPGRREAIRRMAPCPGDSVLEIGIGTGLSLDLYPEGVCITGVDLSEEMLSQAKRRLLRTKRKGVFLQKMDARKLEFADNSFDKSIAMYVASVTPNPAAMIREMRRVTRPGGQFYIVNHFSSRGSAVSLLERMLSPMASVLGFEPAFYLDYFIESTGLADATIYPVRPFGYWLVLVYTNTK